MGAVANMKKYLDSLRVSIGGIDLKKIEAVSKILADAGKNGRTIFICGNGGSAALSLHMACDLSMASRGSGMRGFKAVSLNGNTPLVSAWSNDCGYENCFVEQLKNDFEEKDVLLAISGSGNSENVLRAVRFVNERGGISIGLAGFDGGELSRTARTSIVARADNMQRSEDCHLVVCHLIYLNVSRRI